MKKFTFLLVLLMIAQIANTQSNKDLQMKIQQAQKNISRISKKAAQLNHLQKVNSVSFLKSTSATLKLDSTLSLTLNPETSAWNNDYKDNFFYDTEWKNTSWVEEVWNAETNLWDFSLKTDIGYDDNGRVNSILTYEKDMLTQEMVAYESIIVFYNPEGLIDSTLMYASEYSGATLVLYMKQVNTYDQSKQLTKKEIWGVEDESETIGNLMNIEYKYSTTGKTKTVSNYILSEGEAILWSMIDNSYDSSDKLVTSEFLMLDFFTLELGKSERYTYQYNSSDDVSVETSSLWNGASWDEYYRYTYSYSETNFSEVAFPSYTNLFEVVNLYGLNSMNIGYSNKAIIAIDNGEMTDGSWKTTDKTTFYYSAESPTAVVEFENTLFNAYPNPASGTISFTWKGNYEIILLQMYQITGAKVLEQNIHSALPVSLSGLKSGIYFFRLLQGSQLLYSGKFIKE